MIQKICCQSCNQYQIQVPIANTRQIPIPIFYTKQNTTPNTNQQKLYQMIQKPVTRAVKYQYQIQIPYLIPIPTLIANTRQIPLQISYTKLNPTTNTNQQNPFQMIEKPVSQAVKYQYQIQIPYLVPIPIPNTRQILIPYLR